MNFKQLSATFKHRIDHPEDMVLTRGFEGAVDAFKALREVVNNPKSVTIKIDGSPAIIFGRTHDHTFILTDKAGFSKQNAKQWNSEEIVFNELVSRKPDELGRSNYARSIADLYPILESIFPSNFEGFYQADLLWTSTPPIKNQLFVFQPNKVVYHIPVNSELGKKISHSHYGLVIHSFFADHNQTESIAITDFKKVNFNSNPKIVVLTPEIQVKLNLSLPAIAEELQPVMYRNQKLINELYLGPEIGNFLKSFASFRAKNGKSLEHGEKEFLSWLQTHASEKKWTEVRDFIHSGNNSIALQRLFLIAYAVQLIKTDLYNQLNKQTMNFLGAKLNNQRAQEGFVAATKYAKIKLVNRSVFMNSQTRGRFTP